MWLGSGVDVWNDYSDTQVAATMGTLAAGRGSGYILSGPLSEKLVKLGTKQQNGLELAFGTNFGGLIISTGITMLLVWAVWSVQYAC